MIKKLLLCFAILAPCLHGNIAESELIDAAILGRSKAYAPYSNYPVGASVLTKSGNIYTGCNVENACYPNGCCAEKTAIIKAVSSGDREIKTLVLVTRDGAMPCGSCRQVLNEFNPNMYIVSIDETRKLHWRGELKDILPRAFGPANLD